MLSITDKLIQLHHEGKQVVLCMDEVQAMPIRTLETVRLSIRQLKQRVTFSYNLLPLNKPAMLAYVRHRLAIVGFRGKDLITSQSVDFLHHVSGGIPD